MKILIKKHLYKVQLFESGQLLSTFYVVWCNNPNHIFDKYISYIAFEKFDRLYPCNFISFNDMDFTIQEIYSL